MKRPRSSSIRLAFAVSVLFGLLAVVAGGATYVMQTRALSDQLAEDVKGLALGLAQIASEGDRQDLIEQTMALSGSVGNGSLIAVFVDQLTGESFGNARILTAVDGPSLLQAGRDVEFEKPLSRMPNSYISYASQTKLGTVLVGKDDGPLAHNQRILLASMGFGLGLALLVSIIAAMVIARINEVRIARISRVLDAVGDGSYHQRIGPMGDDDLGHLAAVVDGTLDRLASSIEAIRQVSTDVAHDLRAPLARLRIKLEPLALSVDTPMAVTDGIGNALVEIDSISSTFDAILRLARLESGSTDILLQPVDLVSILKQVQDLFEIQGETAHRVIVDAAVQALDYSCDRDLIMQAVVNLVHNSVHHSLGPVKIALGLTVRKNEVVISVSDDGPGIPAADRERVLRRFVRLDSSRRTPGTGLGLSLVSAIVGVHGGQLKLFDNSPGLRAEMCLPIATYSL